MKKRKKLLGKVLWALFLISLGCCIGIHRKVIMAYLTGSEMPEAPAWHFWVKKD